QRVLEFGCLAEILGHGSHESPIDTPVAPRGFRALSQLPRVSDEIARALVARFGALESLLRAPLTELEDVDGLDRSRAREVREALTIHIPLTDLLLNVPADGAEAVGVRRVIGEAVLEDLARTLTAGDIELEGNWNRRFRRNRDKIKTGDVFEIAEVIRHLAVR